MNRSCPDSAPRFPGLTQQCFASVASRSSRRRVSPPSKQEGDALGDSYIPKEIFKWLEKLNGKPA
jgi:hypothetical protein